MTLWQSLPPEVRAILVRLGAGQHLRIPKRPEIDMGEKIRAEYDAYTRIYGMSDGEAVRTLAKNHNCHHRDIRRFL